MVEAAVPLGAVSHACGRRGGMKGRGEGVVVGVKARPQDTTQRLLPEIELRGALPCGEDGKDEQRDAHNTGR